jgi:hypothetical protein
MPEPDIYKMNEEIVGLKIIVKDLGDNLKATQQTTQSIEKFIIEQRVNNKNQENINQQLVELSNKLTDKTSSDKKEIYAKINSLDERENKHYVENIKENSKQDMENLKHEKENVKEQVQDEKESKTNINYIWMWVFGSIIAILGVYAAFIKP